MMLCRRIDVFWDCNDILCPLGRRHFLKKLFLVLKNKVRDKNLENTYERILKRERGSKFWLPSPEEGAWKIKKRRWKYGAGTGLLNRWRGWHFSYFIFSRIIIFTFRVKLCIWRKIVFFCHNYFRKKGHSRVSKNEPENML